MVREIATPQALRASSPCTGEPGERHVDRSEICAMRMF